MKTYIAILLGVVVLSGVVFMGSRYLKTHEQPEVPAVVSTVTYMTVEGNVERFFEGTSTLAYRFDIPETATTSTSMMGALIKVTDATTSLASMYASYEGGRGYMPIDYITEVVAPHVSVITPVGTSTIGAYEWTLAETPGSNWYITAVNKGEWLVVVEGKKSTDAATRHILETLNVEKVME